MNALDEQTALVTGGGSGIGRAVALALAGAGANVVICGRRMVRLQQTITSLENCDGNGLAIQADVSKSGDVQRLVEAAIRSYGAVDILVNNAADGGMGYIHEHDIETWDRSMAVNLRGPFLLARAVLPHMRARQRGHIINISSESGLAYYPGHGAYGIAKHALNALGEFIQRENQEFGIRVNTICPGQVVTAMTENVPGLDLDRCLQPAEIADLVLWLVTWQPNIKIGRPILVQPMENPWRHEPANE